MTNYELAVLVCGATKSCPCQDKPSWSGPGTHLACKGTGRVFVLGERARKPCEGSVQLAPDDFAANITAKCKGDSCSLCAGRRWFPAILLPPEPCPGIDAITPDLGGVYGHPEECEYGCGGTGQVQRVGIEILLIVLNEANLIVCLTTQGEALYEVSLRQFFTDEIVAMEAASPGRALLEAAAKVLQEQRELRHL